MSEIHTNSDYVQLRVNLNCPNVKQSDAFPRLQHSQHDFSHVESGADCYSDTRTSDLPDEKYSANQIFSVLGFQRIECLK